MIREHEKSPHNPCRDNSDLKNAKFTTVRGISYVDICRIYLFHFRRCRKKGQNNSAQPLKTHTYMKWSVEKEVFNENLIHDDMHRNSLW